MYITWITFGYEHWKTIHDEIGRYRIFTISSQNLLLSPIIIDTEFSDHQLSTKTSKKVMMVNKYNCNTIFFTIFVTCADFLVELEGLGTIYKDSDE